MKNRIGIVLLVLVCLGLAIALITINHQANQQKSVDTQTIKTLSNKVNEAYGQVQDQKQYAAGLQQDLESQKKSFDRALSDLTNNYTLLSSNFVVSKQALKESQEKLKRD